MRVPLPPTRAASVAITVSTTASGSSDSNTTVPLLWKVTASGHPATAKASRMSLVDGCPACPWLTLRRSATWSIPE